MVVTCWGSAQERAAEPRREAPCSNDLHVLDYDRPIVVGYIWKVHRYAVRRHDASVSRRLVESWDSTVFIVVHEVFVYHGARLDRTGRQKHLLTGVCFAGCVRVEWT